MEVRTSKRPRPPCKRVSQSQWRQFVPLFDSERDVRKVVCRREPLSRLCGGSVRRGTFLYIGLIALLLCGLIDRAQAQVLAAKIDYNPTTRGFRIEAAGVSYVLGVNEQEQLQTLNWGKRPAANDQFPQAQAVKGSSSFDPSTGAT